MRSQAPLDWFKSILQASGSSQLIALPVNGNKFKKWKLQIMIKWECPGVKKKKKERKKEVKMVPYELRNHKGGIKVQHPSLVTSALDGSCVVSFTPRSHYPAGKRPCIGLNYEAGRAPDPVWMSSRFLEPAGIRNPGSSSPLPSHRTDYSIAVRTLWLHFQLCYSSPTVTKMFLPWRIPEARGRNTTV